jgi:signal transduction histidine kinase
MNADEKINILMVDDTPANLVSLEAVLSELGQNLVKANSGVEALKCLLKQDFAVILLDVNMGEMDGFETAAWIRQRERSRHTPIIFVTAYHANETDLERGYHLGAVDYIYAPVVPEILRAKVGSFVELAKTNQALQTEIQERKLAEERARQQATRSEALINIASRLNAQLDFSTVLGLVCETTAQALCVPIVLVTLHDNKHKTIEVAAQVGLPADCQEPEALVPFSFQRAHFQEVNEIYLLSDAQKVARLPVAKLYASLNIRTCVDVDMIYNGQNVGNLTIFSAGEVRDFSEDDIALLKGLANQAALAITNAHLFSEAHRSRERLRQLAQQLVIVQEQERQHVSRELHDQAGQILVALQITLGLLQAEIPEEMESPRQQLAEAADLAKQAIDDVRTLARNLRPPILEQTGLNDALSLLCSDFAHYTRLAIRYEGIKNVPELPDALVISLYRFLQEALTNAAKHAQAKEIQVRLVCQNGTISLAVKDDGVGFNVRDQKRLTGIGLLGMQERFEMLGGWLEIESRPGQGTRLAASAPLA